MYPSHPPWHAHIFDDHITEDAVTDTLLTILHSLSAKDWKIAMEDEVFISDIEEIEARRSLLPEALEGMGALVSVIRDPRHLVSKERKREEVVEALKDRLLIDLTDD